MPYELMWAYVNMISDDQGRSASNCSRPGAHTVTNIFKSTFHCILAQNLKMRRVINMGNTFAHMWTNGNSGWNLWRMTRCVSEATRLRQKLGALFWTPHQARNRILEESIFSTEAGSPTTVCSGKGDAYPWYAIFCIIGRTQFIVLQNVHSKRYM